ncbi:MAG: UDP-galactopyranose mutase [Patescibacteria group bacterium]
MIDKKKYDIIVVGAGISGCVIAERFSNISNKKVLVLEKRDHIGGNCYDYVDSNNILVSKYGAHLFHTNYDDVWEYVNMFGDWIAYKHKVLSFVDNQLVPVPVNIKTVNTLLNLNMTTEEEMVEWLNEHRLNINNPKNSEEAALSRVGEFLYNKLFKNYTKKQWDMWPKELWPSVMNRIPVRTDFNDNYFDDKYQALPKNGYTSIFKKMLSNKNITVKLGANFFDFKNDFVGSNIFFTGPIDEFFDYKFGRLQYRSIKFKFETHQKEFYQSNSVINYPNDYKFTRIVEYKHFYPQVNPVTTISKEYAIWGGDPYYPVPNEKNVGLYLKYKEESDKLPNIHFVGRLANYRYFNMDQAFKNALDLFNELKS